MELYHAAHLLGSVPLHYRSCCSPYLYFPCCRRTRNHSEEEWGRAEPCPIASSSPPQQKVANLCPRRNTFEGLDLLSQLLARAWSGTKIITQFHHGRRVMAGDLGLRRGAQRNQEESKVQFPSIRKHIGKEDKPNHQKMKELPVSMAVCYSYIFKKNLLYGWLK